MKKMLSLILAIVMMFALAVGASAEEPSMKDIQQVGSGTYGKDVDIAITGIKNASTVYYVVIDWEAMTFTYNFAETSNVWNPEMHKEEISRGTAGWDKNEASVTITNHSNAAIDVSASFIDDNDKYSTTKNGVTATLYKTAASNGNECTAGTVATRLPSAVGYEKAKEAAAHSDLIAKYTVKVSTGAPARGAGFTIDRLTVTVAPE